MRSSLLLAPICLFCSLAQAEIGQIPFPEHDSIPSIPEQPLQEEHDIYADFDLDSLFDSFDEGISEETPWTRDPECIIDPETQHEHCVYTASTYANGRGISLFVTPSIAKKIASSPAFTSPLLSYVNNYSSLPYEIRHVPGKGNGLFATRTLERGELILADTPVGLYQSDAFPADYETGYQYLRRTFDWLPEDTKTLFKRMSMERQGDIVMERINTNAFSGKFEGESCFMLYPDTALLNHDCRPNAMYHHDPQTLIQSTYAARTIEAGEEITISYINLLQPHASRQQFLAQMYAFECTCALCSAASTPSQASEARVHKILTLQTILGDWSQSSGATPEHALQLLKLYEKEKLWSALGSGYQIAALAYSAEGDVKKAKEYAEEALNLGVGVWGGEEEGMRALVKEGKRHWSFGARSKKRGLF